ncbi:MAG: hypothetical protein AAGA62_06740, partial [Bacteroidota bacterium]
SFVPYQVGESLDLQAAPTLETQTGLLVRFSPQYFHELRRSTPLFGIKVGFDVAFNLQHSLSHQAVNDRVLAFSGDVIGTEAVETVLPNSLANGFFKPLQVHYIGIRVGFFWRQSDAIN